MILGVCLMSLGVRLMSLGVRMKRELGDEFGGGFDEFDEFRGCVCCAFVAFRDAVDEFGGVLMTLGVGLERGCV